MGPEESAELQERLQRLSRASDPSVAAPLATELLEELRELQAVVSALRDDAVLALHAGGKSLHEVGRIARLTRGRVFQIVQRGRRAGSDGAVPG